MIKKVLSSLLGVAVVLAWWTIRGSRTAPEEVRESIPDKVWSGGGGTLAIDLDTSVAGKMSIEFHERRDDGRNLTTLERVGPGSHSWSVEVPPNAGGYIEFDAEAPQPGATLSWTIRHDGRQIAEDSEKLDRPLRSDEALFLQEYYDDFSNPGAPDDDEDG